MSENGRNSQRDKTFNLLRDFAKFGKICKVLGGLGVIIAGRELWLKEWTERELVACSRKGDRSAYADLVRAHSARVFAICLGILGNRPDAEDAAQQVLLKGFAEIRQFKEPGKFAAWIGRIARNWCLDVLRRQKRTRRALAQHAAEQTAPGPVGSTTGAGNEQQPEYPELEAALGRLPEEYRLCLILYYFDGRSARSIAETFDISESAVHVRMSRAREKLRELLDTEAVQNARQVPGNTRTDS